MEPARRSQQYLEPLKTPPKDKGFVVFDIESKDGDTQKPGFTRPFQLGFHTGLDKGYISFRNKPHVAKLPWFERAVCPGGCVDQFMRHLLGGPNDKGESPYAGYDVYAHNMGSFDGLFLPAWLERNNQWVTYKIMPVQARIQAIEIWRYNKSRYRGNAESVNKANKKDREAHGVIRILDSFRILPVALDKIAQAFGFEGKLKKMSLATHEDDPIWEEYNEIDCMQLYKVIQKYKDLIMQQLGGEVGITAPSTAIKLLRRKYLPEDIRIHRNIHFEDCSTQETCNGCAHEFFRSAYFGGRTEIYNTKGTGWYYDVNSSYPFSMTKPQPVGEMYEMGENEDFTKYADDENYIGFIRCTVDIPDTTYLPSLPVQHGGKLKFPAGRFSGTWNWVELKSFRQIPGAKIIHVEKSVWVRAHRFLTMFIADLYAMRKEGNPQYKGKALSEVAKLTMNSTFGKFGMDQNRIEMIILKPGEEEPWEARYPGESDKHRKQRKHAEHENDHTYHVTTPMGADEPHEDFEARRKRERKGDFTGARWRVPDLPTASGIYEHDSLVRIRDIKVDAAYIIPQIAAHITSSSRILLWGFAADVVDRCQTCQTCGEPYTNHFICKDCGDSVVNHRLYTPELLASAPCKKFVSTCEFMVPCPYPKHRHGPDLPCNFTPHQIYYSDTDSLLSSFGDYPESKDLGALKKEYQEPITIESFAPKMYRLSKATPFEGAHVLKSVDGKSKKSCATTCPGCRKPTDDEKKSKSKKLLNGRVVGEHAPSDHVKDSKTKQCEADCPACAGKPNCADNCPGCACEKIMMKGVPKDMRNMETIDKLLIKREEVSYAQHEKLGALAKRGFRDTPRMQTIKKSMKSKYDKRKLADDGSTTPISLRAEKDLSDFFRQNVPEDYRTPDWLINIVAPPEPQ